MENDKKRTAYEIAVQDRSTLRYYAGLLIRWKQQWKYRYARYLARKNGATIGEGAIMPISLAKKANKNLEMGGILPSRQTNSTCATRLPSVATSL